MSREARAVPRHTDPPGRPHLMPLARRTRRARWAKGQNRMLYSRISPSGTGPGGALPAERGENNPDSHSRSSPRAQPRLGRCSSPAAPLPAGARAYPWPSCESGRRTSRCAPMRRAPPCRVMLLRAAPGPAAGPAHPLLAPPTGPARGATPGTAGTSALSGERAGGGAASDGWSPRRGESLGFGGSSTPGTLTQALLNCSLLYNRSITHPSWHSRLNGKPVAELHPYDWFLK